MFYEHLIDRKNNMTAAILDIDSGFEPYSDLDVFNYPLEDLANPSVPHSLIDLAKKYNYQRPKICRGCGKAGLFWISSGGKWKLADESGFHICKGSDHEKYRPMGLAGI